MSSPREREKRDNIVEEMNERDREESGIGMKVKEIPQSQGKKKLSKKHSPSILAYYKESRLCPTVNQYQLDAPVT